MSRSSAKSSPPVASGFGSRWAASRFRPSLISRRKAAEFLAWRAWPKFLRETVPGETTRVYTYVLNRGEGRSESHRPALAGAISGSNRHRLSIQRAALAGSAPRIYTLKPNRISGPRRYFGPVLYCASAARLWEIRAYTARRAACRSLRPLARSDSTRIRFLIEMLLAALAADFNRYTKTSLRIMSSN